MIDRRNLLLGSLAAMLPARAAADGRQPAARTVDYGPAKLDIYARDGAGNDPVVFFIHGGAWRIGSRANVGAKPGFLLANRFLFVSVDYRVLPVADVAAQASDVEAAFAYVRANIAAFGGDPGRIVAMGHSAGCHLAALTGLRGGLPGVVGLVLDDTEAYDLRALADAHGGKLRSVYAQAFADRGQWQALSPATYIRDRKHPPVFIAYSDSPIRAAASHEFADRLRAAGTKVTLFDGSAYSHMSINRRFGEDGDALTGAVMAFLRAIGA